MSDSAAPAAALPGPGGARLRLLESGMLPLAWLAVTAGFALTEPGRFLSAGNAANILGSQAVLLVLALALLFPLTAGDMDLSAGGICGLSAMLIAVLNGQHGVPAGLACLAGLAAGVITGLASGTAVLYSEAHRRGGSRAPVSLAVTLGTLIICGGIAEVLSGEQTITGVSAGLTGPVFTDGLAGIPYEAYYGAGLVVVVCVVLQFTRWGHHLLITGLNREAARGVGIGVRRMRMTAFALAGLTAALSGVLYAGTTGSATASDGTSLTLPALAGVFLGSTCIQPGRYNAPGTAIAVWFLASGTAGLELAGAQDSVQSLFYGAVLIAAVVLSGAPRRRRGRKGAV